MASTATDFSGVRKTLYRDYFLFFIFNDEEIVVLALFDTRRNPDSMKDVLGV
ncbi:MAG: hypothetical protein SH856_14415 [Flavobacteriales bacterium]|nr:hypothetical protein [Flavobacteriales bacterium]